MTDTPPKSCPIDAPCMLRLERIQGVCEANQKTLVKLDKLLHGNGEAPGLKTRVDRLEQTSKHWGKLYGLALAAVFSVIGALVLIWLKNGGPAG